MNDTATNHGAAIPLPEPAEPAAPPPSKSSSPEEIERLVRMHKEAAVLNRVTIRTNFQQAIQDALLAKDEKNRRSVSALCTAFHQWAGGEANLGLS